MDDWHRPTHTICPIRPVRSRHSTRRGGDVPRRVPDRLLARLLPEQADGVRRGSFAGLRWVPPAARGAAPARAHRAHDEGVPFVLVGPTEEEPAHYAARMRLGRVL